MCQALPHGTATAQSRLAHACGTRDAGPWLWRRTDCEDVRLGHDCCLPHVTKLCVVGRSYPRLREAQSVSQSVSHYHTPSREHIAHTITLLSRVRVRQVSLDLRERVHAVIGIAATEPVLQQQWPRPLDPALLIGAERVAKHCDADHLHWVAAERGGARTCS